MNSEQFSHWCQTFTTAAHLEQPPLIMGILNVTPNSFSDGGLFLHPEQAYRKAMMQIEQGADILDIGGESTKPGAKSITDFDELKRVIPVITAIRKISDICISIDTSKPQVMKAAVEAGASIINDVTALKAPGSLGMASQLKVPVCLMHMQGTPQTMQINPHYPNDIVNEINSFFGERMETCIHAGIPKENLIFDPGFGFGKTVKHNLSLVRHLREFQQHERPILLGASRKSTLGAILNADVSERLAGGLAVLIFAAMQGIKMVRTHDVKESIQALRILNAIVKEESLEKEV